jgi:hypothetical protein
MLGGFSLMQARGGTARGRMGGRRTIVAGLAAVAVETAALWLRSSRIGGNVVVRCRERHLFTTIWIPGASVKALRWRFQRCPVGPHWSWVTPVRESELAPAELALARERRDMRIP